MSEDLPPYYFRIRENGAFVFRIARDQRQQRIETKQIATVNIRNSDIRPQGDHVLTPDELLAIENWMAERRAILETRAIEDVKRTIEQLNVTTHWLQSRASQSQIEQVSDDLLLAILDLRTVIVRKKAEPAVDS